MAWYHRLHNLVRPKPLDRAIEDELSFHLAERTDELVAKGRSEASARREARRQFGSATSARERTREVKTMHWLESMGKDVRFALRTFRRNPVFTAVAVLTLALGIGANTAIFTLLDAVVMRPLPVEAPDRLVVFGGMSRGTSFSADPVEHSSEQFSYPLYEDLRGNNEVFDELAAIRTVDTTVYVREPGRATATLPEPAIARQVSGNYFRTLRIRAARGRTLEADDDRIPGAHPVAVVSDGYWRRRFASDPAIVGTELSLNGRTFTVVGVLPAGFHGETVGSSPDLYTPLMMQEAIEGLGRIASREWTFLLVFGRLRDDVTHERAEAAMTIAFRQALRAEIGDELSPAQSARLAARRIALVGPEGFSRLRRDYGAPLQLLMGLVGLVLLIACANVANLLLGRAVARQRELGMRAALGAGRGRLVRQLLTESLLLAGGGAVVGVAAGVWAEQGLARMVFQTTVAPVELGLDGRTLAFTIGLLALTALLFGLAPAWRATGTSLAIMGAGARSHTSRSGLRRSLVVAQVGLSLVLLIGAGVFIANLRQLREVDLGLQTEHLHVVELDFSTPGFVGPDGDEARRRRLYRTLLDRVRRLPDIDAAALSQQSLFARSMVAGPVRVEGESPIDDPDALVFIVSTSSGYFDAAGTPLLDGRGVVDTDRESTPRVAIVNQAFADRYLPHARAIGRRFRFVWEEDGWREIVGVAADARYNSLKGRIPPQVFIPADQSSFPLDSLAVRTRRDAAWVGAEVRRIVREVEPTLPVRRVTTVEGRVDGTLVQERVLATLTGVFGSLGLLVAAVGLFGVMNYAVARRTREIGVRIALGAEPRTVRWMVLRDALLLVGLGTAAGLVAAVPLTRLVGGLLYQVSPADPSAIGSAVLLLTTVAAVAAALPARRAARVDPMVSLRSE